MFNDDQISVARDDDTPRTVDDEPTLSIRRGAMNDTRFTLRALRPTWYPLSFAVVLRRPPVAARLR